MLTTLAAVILGSTWSATPSADVWVYPHSSNPGGEAFMRVWGDGSKPIDTMIPPSDAYSYGYVAFALKDLPKGKLKKAELTVWNAPNDGLTAEEIKANPLEVFGMKGDFKEDGFSFDGSTCGPIDPSFGPSTFVQKNESGIQLTINLLTKEGAFAKALEAAGKTGTIYLALGSKISPAESRSMIYKIATKESPEKLRPVLTIETEE